MGWHAYDLDHLALEIVLRAKERDKKDKTDSRNQAHKMRAACAYGLERFWGEHLRLEKEEPNKAKFIADVWHALVSILAKTGILLPDKVLTKNSPEEEIANVANQLWNLNRHDQSLTLAVLTNLCDAVVWWTQRLMVAKEAQD
ncbi:MULTISPECIES: hypothetical protein [unclassified Synechococcus]|uniref:hypothetical protein n=1 Tax=unclassified Synechococcus TaxID=2626047 RepID=UPI0021A40D52|nr:MULTISPECIES: hypothetical protein [unclassified Synechococcus]MCT0212422.1 hypothetical protein [Synechococcus sp. CS-1326]MCT0234605.1 hypothetical protein [Synechococcus sp. CS-1327]